MLIAFPALAQEPRMPARVSVVVGLTRYEEFPGWPGYLVAQSKDAGVRFWVQQVFPQVLPAGKAAPPITITSLTHDAPGEALVVVDSSKRTHRVSIREKERGTHWPTRIELVKEKPLTVRLTIPNPGPEPLSLDTPSVCASGRTENDVFEMAVDGVDVPYRGKMKKRAPPDDFTVVKPGTEFSVVVDLSAEYQPAPKGTLTLKFSTFNHFSGDEVTLVSNVLELKR